MYWVKEYERNELKKAYEGEEVFKLRESSSFVDLKELHEVHAQEEATRRFFFINLIATPS